MQSNAQSTILPPQWIPTGLYVLINNKTKTLLDLRGGHTESGSPCEGWPRNFGEKIDHQFWVISRNQADGNHRIMSYRAGTFLDLRAGKCDPGSPVVAYNYVDKADSRFNQEWRISTEMGSEYSTIECVRSGTVLEIADGKAASGTPVTCSPHPHHKDHHHENHQLWKLERVSRTRQEIQNLLGSWKPELAGHLIHPLADDVQYFVLPDKLRGAIYNGTKLLNQPVRKGTFDYGDFVIKAKDAVKTWARDRFRIDGYSVLFGIIYGEAARGPKAYNWYLSSDMQSLVFLDPQANKEYKVADLDHFKFKPTVAIL